MSEREGYSDYIAVVSNTINVLALVSGFMFASLTVLLTALPDLSSVSSQLVLFIAAFFLDVFVFLLLNAVSLPMLYCKMPPVTKRIATFNALLLLALMIGMGMVTTAMFFAYNLTYLGLAQLVMWLLMSIVAHVYLIMPMGRMRRSGDSE
jgi:hypothetical protein